MVDPVLVKGVGLVGGTAAVRLPATPEEQPRITASIGAGRLLATPVALGDF